MIGRIFSVRIPGTGAWPVDDGESLDIVASEDVLMQRAAHLPASRVLCWLTPFEELIVAPDRVPDMIAEIHAAVGDEPTLLETRAADRLARFLQRAHSQQHYVRIVDVP